MGKGKHMNDATSTGIETPHDRKPKGRIAPAIARVLLGLMFLLFGLDGFLNFIPKPKEMPAEIATVTSGLIKGGYMTVVAGTEVIVAVLLLTNCFVPLALALLAPIVVGIITFHIAIAPQTIGPGIVVLLMELYLAWANRGAFKPMLRAKTTPGA